MRHKMEISLAGLDHKKLKDTLSNKNFEYDDLYGALIISNGVITVEVNVYYIQLYVEFKSVLSLLRADNFYQYTYIDIVDCIDIFKMERVGDKLYEFKGGGVKVTFKQDEVETLFSSYIKQFEENCLEYGEVGVQFLSSLK